MIVCWAAFTAIVGCVWPVGCGSATLDPRGSNRKGTRGLVNVTLIHPLLTFPCH